MAPHADTSTLAVALVLVLEVASASTAHAADNRYRVKPSEIAIPQGATLGEVRRTFRPFPNWTLICDENMRARVKICNVTQSFIDEDGTTVFSWSLAASKSGNPVFILRAPTSVGPSGRIQLKISTGQALSTEVQGCDATTCIAMLPLGPGLRSEIAKGEPIEIGYGVDEPVTLLAPLYGLAKAIAAID